MYKAAYDGPPTIINTIVGGKYCRRTALSMSGASSKVHQSIKGNLRKCFNLIHAHFSV